MLRDLIYIIQLYSFKIVYYTHKNIFLFFINSVYKVFFAIPFKKLEKITVVGKLERKESDD